MNTKHLEQLPEGWPETTAVCASLGDEVRQRILLLFGPQEELSIKTISDQFALGRSTIVHHLSVMEKSGVLQVRRQGKEALYSIAYDTILEALVRLQRHVENDLRAIVWKHVGTRASQS